MIHHSDRGGEYSSHALERELRRHGALASMGSVADCYDNALAESVFATPECELFDQQPGGRFATRREAKLAVFDYLETFYNPRRRHSAVGLAHRSRSNAPTQSRPARTGRPRHDAPSRDDSVTTTAACRACGRTLTTVVGRQAYCSAACRQRAYRARQPSLAPPAALFAAPRRNSAAYQCPDCDSRYSGQQRCDDCNTFCTRLGLGGTCPCCEEVITLDELLTALPS